MTRILILLAAVLAAFLFLWAVFYKKQTSKEKPTLYICHECGEKDCNCYKEEDKVSPK